MSDLTSNLVDRFFRYVAVTSQSNPAATQVPSTPGQRELAILLAAELKELGLKDIHIDEHSIVTAFRPGNQANAPKIGFVAHLDTVDVGLSPYIKPQVLHFTGEDLCLNKEQNIWLRVADHPEIIPYKNQDIIFSDGTSVLGADNKAAITVVMQLLADLNKEAANTGDIYVAFVPDEEIGLRGAKVLDLDRFPVDFAYTIDCCEQGEVVYETFNAASVSIGIKGVTAHPMSAKNVLVNPILVAKDLMGCFDSKDTPEHTDGRQGYFWFTDMTANATEARLSMSIRDFDLASFEARKRFVQDAVALISARHPKAEITCKVTDVYGNIGNSLKGEPHPSIDLILAAFSELGIEPNVIAMRGGTDGSALSPRGIITPNYFTGALNFHSKFEFLPLNAFANSYHVTRKICELATKS